MPGSEYKVDAAFTESLDAKKTADKLKRAKDKMFRYKSDADNFSSLTSLSLPDYRLKRKFDEATGKVTFELESGERRIKLSRINAPKRLAKKLYFKSNSYFHGKVSEHESENQSVEAFHKGEMQLEDLGNRAISYLPGVDSISRKITRELYRNAKRASENYNRLLFEKEISESKDGNPVKELFKKEKAESVFKNSKTIKKKTQKELEKVEKERIKKLQKQQIKKQIKKKVVKEGAKQTGKEVTKKSAEAAVVVTEKTGEGIIANVIGLATGIEEGVLIAVAVVAAIIELIATILLIIGLICSLIFFYTNVLASMYQSDPLEIEKAELHMTYLEANLKDYVENIEVNVPDYDGYVIECDDIGHNPFTLINYLSAKYGKFTFDEVESEIDDLFNECYTITTWVEETEKEVEEEEPSEEPEDEEGDESDEEEEEIETIYTYHIKVTRNSFALIVMNRMNDDEKVMFNTYWDTHGGLQGFASPVDFDWYGSVSSYYGYRYHPIDESIKLHRGVDIAMPEGTNLYSGISGVVTTVGNDADGYGIYVVIENEEGIVCKYAHMQATSGIAVGQPISKGELIGYSGNTGKSTGPHLHMECMKDGVYYNPIFYFESD